MDKQIILGFIGSGNMASAMIKGIISSGLTDAQNIIMSDADKSKAEALAGKFGTRAAESNRELVRQCNVIVLSVKPNHIDEVLSDIYEDLNEKQLIISIAAGVEADHIKKAIKGRCSVIRTMPNTPALVGEGMTAICRDNSVSAEYMDIAGELFSSFGMVELINESQIHAATAISGSSPAYAYLFIEALADGGVLLGLNRDQSCRMAAQALLGAAKMVLESGLHPGSLKDMVCSPGGTTIEAVASLERDGFRGAVIEAARICAEKSGLMGRNKR